ncbi:MAG: ABC transporter ATP-binding protein [Pseudomonadota bacterium]
MTATLIELDAVSKQYALGESLVLALDDVSLGIGAGEFAAVWGPSGSGKSTLLNLIGLIDQPSKGAVRIEGQNTHALSDRALTDIRFRTLGFVFQNYNLVPVLSALENVMLPLQIRGAAEKPARVKAEALLEAVGLSQQMHSRPDKMSGGQRQRVAVARALVTDPRIVLADEPTANLDSRNSQIIIDLMRDLNQSRGVTFVFSTHDQQLLDHVDRHIHMRDGKIIGDRKCTPAAAAKAVLAPA